jgi:predicted phosphodiesterase
VQRDARDVARYAEEVRPRAPERAAAIPTPRGGTRAAVIRTPRRDTRAAGCVVAVVAGVVVAALGADGVAAQRASRAAGVRKGPYLMDLRPDGVAVMLETTEDMEIEVEAVGADGLRARGVSSRRRLHEIVLRDLPPATRLTYEVRGDGQRLGGGSFATAPPPEAERATFLVYGDTRNDAATHAAVVARMRDEAADFVLHTGDLVADGRDPADWQEFFDGAGALFAELPLFTVLGNHETWRDGSGLPNYQRYVRVDDRPGDEAFYAIEHGPVRILVLDSNQSLEDGTPQRRWLDAELGRLSRGDRPGHLIAAIHHGPYSSGSHGPNERLIAAGVEQALREAGVELLLQGHDHTYERGEARGVKYLVSGGGGAPLYVTNRRLPYQLAFQPVHHYLRVEVDGSHVQVTAIRADGTEIESCGYVTGGPWECARPRRGGAPGAGPVTTTGGGLLRALLAAWPLIALAAGVALVVGLGVRRVRDSRRQAAARARRALAGSGPGDGSAARGDDGDEAEDGRRGWPDGERRDGGRLDRGRPESGERE